MSGLHFKIKVSHRGPRCHLGLCRYELWVLPTANVSRRYLTCV